MKAEHRKELETNTLADRMGQAMQRVRTGNRRAFVVTIIVAVAVAVGSWLTYRYITEGRQQSSDAWLRLDDGSAKSLVELKKDGSVPVGKAAKLQYAWMAYWEAGVKKIGTDPRGAMIAIDEAGKTYKEVAEECKDEDPPLFLPQALLGVAVVDECRAIQDTALLKKAKAGYEALQDKKFEGTAEAKFARDRLDQLKDPKKGPKIAAVYEDLQKRLGVRVRQEMPDLMPRLKGLDGPLPPPKK